VRDSIEASGDVETAAREAMEQGSILAVQMRSELSRDLGDYPEGWTVAAGLRPAEGLVAGDCYDVGLLSPATVGLVVLDIAGHGALSAVSALRCKDLLKAGLRSGMAPGQAFGWLMAQDHGLSGTFLTGFVAVIDTTTGVTRYASAGHPEGLLRHDAAVTPLPPTGPIVGPVAAEWRTEQVVVPPGGALVVYTDGLIETRNDRREFYGFDRLRDLVRSVRSDDAQPFVAELLQDLDTFQPSRVADDVTLVVACRTADIPASGVSDPRERERAPQ
jgi:serine phosphatase RsbU (regulator of sigma subunit)